MTQEYMPLLLFIVLPIFAGFILSIFMFIKALKEYKRLTEQAENLKKQIEENR